MIEQLKWTAEAVCSCFHVPAYKIGVGTPPAYNNIEALQQDYYSTCLQILIEDMELCQDEGLALPANYGTALDLDAMLRMHTKTQVDTLAGAVAGSCMTINQAATKLGLPKVYVGDTKWI